MWRQGEAVNIVGYKSCPPCCFGSATYRTIGHSEGETCGETRVEEDMPIEDTVLGEIDKLLKEEGMVSPPSSTPLEVEDEDPTKIQSEKVEPSKTFSFEDKAEIFLKEL